MRLDPHYSVPSDSIAFEAAVDFMARIDTLGRFLYISGPGLNFIGYHREYLKIVTLADLVPADEVGILRACLEMVRETRCRISAPCT